MKGTYKERSCRSRRRPPRSIVRVWEEEAEGLIRPYLQSKPEFRQDIGQLSMVLVVKGVLEYLRYALLGRNSFSEQQPHPHSSCAASIVETGRVQPFPREFAEGQGYAPPDPVAPK